jgi:predicted RNA-binding Zn-ribbon protein involved in translation (DUF1610 family)
MGLSCSCGEWEGEGICYYHPSDFTPLKTSKRKRCKSCGVLINIGDDCLKFDRMRSPASEVEINIYGEYGEVWLASHYQCEDCGCLYMALDELGFCLSPDDNMAEMLEEYQRDYAHPAWKSFKEVTK